MRSRFLGVSLVVTGLCLAISVPLLAHHAFTAEFDVDKPVSINGTITKLDWINPHVYIYVDEKGADGKVTNWQVGSFGTGNCNRAGLTRARLHPGSVVKIQGYRAKDGTKNLAYLRHITFEDGTQLELWVGGANGSPDQQR